MMLDLNCDLGEGEPPRRTRALMQCVTSANVACGGHAGDAKSMRQCARLAARYRVHLGAHPGTRDNFGRTAVPLSPEEMEHLLVEQVGALAGIGAEEGVPLHHIKLHGALYHATERDARLARRYLNLVARHWPGLIVYALARGRVAALAGKVIVWEESFLDRRYRADGSLVPRDQPGAMLKTAREQLEQSRRLMDRGEVATENGGLLRLKPRTLCLHSDTPGAARLARLVGHALRA